MIDGTPWKELKHLIGKKISMQKMLSSLNEADAATLK